MIGSELWSDDPGFAEATATTGVTGICGSGIIEAVAEMRLAGLVDAVGPDRVGRADRHGAHACPRGARMPTCCTTAGRRAGRSSLVTQGDVRAIQLAKSALYAGARLLMDEMGVDKVDRVVLAGAFGAHISPKHAMVLGMIPDCDARPGDLGRERGRHRRAHRAAATRPRGAQIEATGARRSTRSRRPSSRASRSISWPRTRSRMRPPPSRTSRARAAAGRAFQRRRRPRRRPPPPARLDRGRRDPRCAADDEAPDHGPLTPARFARRPAAGEDWRRDAHGRCHDGP